MYVQGGNFGVSWRPPTVPLIRILRNTFFLMFQYPGKAGTLCIFVSLHLMLVVLAKDTNGKIKHIQNSQPDDFY